MAEARRWHQITSPLPTLTSGGYKGWSARLRAEAPATESFDDAYVEVIVRAPVDFKGDLGVLAAWAARHVSDAGLLGCETRIASVMTTLDETQDPGRIVIRVWGGAAPVQSESDIVAADDDDDGTDSGDGEEAA